MIKTLMAGTAGLALAIPVAAPAFAGGGHHGDGVITRGTCSATADWKLKVEPEDGGVEVEFEVESGVVGQSWNYTMSGPSGEIVSGSATTDDRGELEVKATAAGTVTDVFTGAATDGSQTCDSTVGVLPAPAPGDHHGDDPADDHVGPRGEHHHEGECTDASVIDLAVKQAGKQRVATLSVTSGQKGQKWRYEIKRGSKTVGAGSAKTRGKKAAFKVKARTRGQGVLTADAHPVDGSEHCTADDQTAA